MKILLVEDDKTIAAGLEYSLQQENFSTVLCTDAESARMVIAEDPGQFSLCLLDLSLPDGSGYDLCQMIKARGDILPNPFAFGNLFHASNRFCADTP